MDKRCWDKRTKELVLFAGTLFVGFDIIMGYLAFMEVQPLVTILSTPFVLYFLVNLFKKHKEEIKSK